MTPPKPQADVERERALKIAQEMWQQNRCLCMNEVGAHAHWPGEHAIADALLTHAREARRLAFEEAAEIADAHVIVGHVSSTPDALVQEAVRNHLGTRIAAAIRARAQASGGAEEGE